MCEMVQAERQKARTGAYEVRVRRSWVWNLSRMAVSLGIALWILDPFDGNVTTSSGVIGGSVLLLNLTFWTSQFRLRALGCLMRIDAAGVTVAGQPTVPWKDLAKAEVLKQRSLVLVPRSPEVELPLAPTGFRPLDAQRKRRRLTARFGSPLIVYASVYGEDMDDLVAAVRRYSGGLPVFD
ncbi:hypothetical protein [Streptomyces sp. NPDC049040]|uniref:hypothetical protein n=1 Tax=Streptomyces sp. NPDC049040 TaxID=3365593 RepID=UPI00371E14F1